MFQKETTHTLYLGPDGALTWVAAESNVHSDEADPGKRAAEDQSYIGPALLGAHPVARGLQALGPDTLVRTTVVREERPFHVITEARFARADRALERLLRGQWPSGTRHDGARRRADGAAYAIRLHTADR